ncbi:Hypp8100 [Branchiostoma lanceolatum]|uniref:Hypp8100 protein n=1 Tax=Branchiostoma lanceolatum TaxID=7740 RepID=A0A8K0EH43_BRALA|nr:Hypp8100 [Branchiostoma lanceolatum]
MARETTEAGSSQCHDISASKPKPKNTKFRLKHKKVKKQRQEAETNPIETKGVDINDKFYDTTSNASTHPPACLDAKEEPVDVNNSPVVTLDMKRESHKKKRKRFVVRFSKKTKETKDTDVRRKAHGDVIEKVRIEIMSDDEKREELLGQGTTVVNPERNTETPWKKAKRKQEEKDISSESDQTEEKLSDIHDGGPKPKMYERKWPRLLKKKLKTSDSVPGVVVKSEQPKQTLEDLQREVQETQKIVRDIVENKIAERDKQLQDLTRVAEDLEKAGKQFATVSRKVHVKMWLRSRKWTIFMICMVVAVLSVVAIVVCVMFV